VLLRAYGNDTSILIDRERLCPLLPSLPNPALTASTGECSSHLLLSKHGLAPPLLARFANGLLYRFVAGRVCSVDDLSVPETWKAVAERLGEWHGVLPTTPATTGAATPDGSGTSVFWGVLRKWISALPSGTDAQTPDGSGTSDLWGVLRKWISALPSGTDAQKAQKEELRRELSAMENTRVAGGYGLKGCDGGVGLVTGHCDLLNGNVIILPSDGARKVHLIDEYSTPCERAFDIANHFAEWGGFDCEYEKLPTKSTRHEFIRVYLESFHQHRKDGVEEVSEEEVQKLMDEVDLFRGLPGFYWYTSPPISLSDYQYANSRDIGESGPSSRHRSRRSTSTMRSTHWYDWANTAPGKTAPLRCASSDGPPPNLFPPSPRSDSDEVFQQPNLCTRFCFCFFPDIHTP